MMSSDNFNFVGKSGRVWLNLDASGWLGEPLTEQELLDRGVKPTVGATIEDAFNEYAEYGPVFEDPSAIEYRPKDG